MVSMVAIGRVELVRLLRDRSNIFFVFVFPLLLVVMIGAGFGGSMDATIGVVVPDDDATADELVAALDAADGAVTLAVADADELRSRVERGGISAGLVVPDGYGAALAAGEPVTLAWVARPDSGALALRQLVEAAAGEQGAASTAAAVAADALGAAPGELTAVVEQVRGGLPGIEVAQVEVGGDPLAAEFARLGQFDLGASSQLVLFTFLTAMVGGLALIQTRQLGVATRMVSTPTSVTAILLGQAAGRVLVALFQAGYIVVATLLLFQVSWGDPLGAAAVIVLFCLAAGGAGMLVGTLARTESQASGLGIGLGIGLAALGGSMIPLEIFPEGMRSVARLTPHAWANEAFAELVRRDGTVVDIAVELAALAGFAAVLLGLATWRLYRVLVR